MAHLPKRRSKRPAPEPLDWRALANGPALRGLNDVLATPGAVASERAARRLALEQEELSTETPTVWQPPTVGVSVDTTAGIETAPRALDDVPRSISSLPPSGLQPFLVPTLQTPTVVDPPTVVSSTTVGVSDTSNNISTDSQPHRHNIPPSGPLTSSTSQTPTVGETPTVATFPTVGVSLVTSLHLPTPQQPLETPTVAALPTVGESPTVGVSTETNDQLPQQNASPAPLPSPTVGVFNDPPKHPGKKSPSTAAPSAKWIDKAGNNQESARVIRVNIAQQSMTLGEERFYQALWHAKDSDGVVRESPQSKTFSMGYDRLARLVRLDEKSIRQLIPRLADKRILELLAGENCSARVGKTYRIFSYEEILERQRKANMQFVVKRGRAVEFVWPAKADQTATPPTTSQTPTVVDTPTVGQSPTDSVGGSPTVSVGESPTPLDNLLDTSSSQTSSSVYAALAKYAAPDDDAVRAIIANCRKHAPDASTNEIIHFIHEKGNGLKSGKIANPLAFLIVYVPKCFQPETLGAYRKQVQAEIQRHQETARRAEDEVQRLRAEWNSWLLDPAVTEEDKSWVRKMLADGI